jgi:hypothetical protein
VGLRHGNSVEVALDLLYNPRWKEMLSRSFG